MPVFVFTGARILHPRQATASSIEVFFSNIEYFAQKKYMESFEIKPVGSLNDIEGFLKNLFCRGSRAYELLKSAIERELRPNGAPDVKRMAIDRIAYNAGTGKGSLRVVLDISYTFGCEDLVTNKNDETSEWTFFVDTDSGAIIFSGSPYADSRSTADEF